MCKYNRRVWFAIATVVAIVFAAQGDVCGAAETISNGDALAQFSFEGTTFATTLNEFHRRYPAAILNRDDSDEKIGLRNFAVVGTKAADGAFFTFLDQQLHSIQIFYYPERINKMGGAYMVSKKVFHAFGSPIKTETKGDADRAVWSVDGKTAILSIIPSVLGIKVTDDAVDAQIKERQGLHADLGF